jgi:glyoxylase-like metal-dependent hydrolase (beta-lactamase superfamily II)
MELEDTCEDIIGKAARGLHLDDDQLIARAGISLAQLQAARRGRDLPAVRALAIALGLNPSALADISSGSWQPAHQPLMPGLQPFVSSWGKMLVNAYLVWDPHGHEAALFDTGADAEAPMKFARDHHLKLQQVFITHTHADHVFDLERVVERTGATAHVCELEPLHIAQSFEPGAGFHIGTLRVHTALTDGHSHGGITYRIEGLARPVAICGDAVFAGSMGGPNTSYPRALESARAEILRLDDATLLCPGHGPMTTVGEERRHNPFLAEPPRPKK